MKIQEQVFLESIKKSNTKVLAKCSFSRAVLSAKDTRSTIAQNNN